MSEEEEGVGKAKGGMISPPGKVYASFDPDWGNVAAWEGRGMNGSAMGEGGTGNGRKTGARAGSTGLGESVSAIWAGKPGDAVGMGASLAHADMGFGAAVIPSPQLDSLETGSRLARFEDGPADPQIPPKVVLSVGNVGDGIS